MPTLLVSVRFHDGRYHGSGEWPPSPARLFQALVAGAARGENLSEHAVEAFEWLESLDAPAIAAPPSYAGQPFKTFVPNNDLDAVGGDPARIGEIRAGKIIRPRTFDAAVPLLYAWTFEHGADAERHARTICEIADNLYQLGRGVDMAWAKGEIADDERGRTLAFARTAASSVRRTGAAVARRFHVPARFAGEPDKALRGDPPTVQDDRNGQGGQSIFLAGAEARLRADPIQQPVRLSPLRDQERRWFCSNT